MAHFGSLWQSGVWTFRIQNFFCNCKRQK